MIIAIDAGFTSAVILTAPHYMHRIVCVCFRWLCVSMPNKPENLRLNGKSNDDGFLWLHIRHTHTQRIVVTFSKDRFNESIFDFRLFLSFYRMIRTGSTQNYDDGTTKSESVPIKKTTYAKNSFHENGRNTIVRSCFAHSLTRMTQDSTD